MPLWVFLRLSSDGLLLWVALQLVELDAVQLLEALATVFAGEVVVGLRRVLLHVPVEGGSLPTLVAADLTPVGKEKEEREGKKTIDNAEERLKGRGSKRPLCEDQVTR